MLLLEKVFQTINESGLDYCIQNKYEMMPEEIPSDIDMMYRNADESFLDQLVIKVAKETRLLVTQKIVQGYYEYTYILSYPIPQKRFQMQLDFYSAISRKDYPNVMPAAVMLENKRFYKCFYVPDYFDELQYMFIRRTIKNDMKPEHLEIARQMYLHSPQEYDKRLEHVFGKEAAVLIKRCVDTLDCNIFEENKAVFRKSVKAISQKNCASSKFQIMYRKFQIFEVIPKRVIHKSGISVAFLSPDGGGKSTAIKAVSEQVSGSFYGNVELYFRPHYLSNAGSYKLYNKTSEETTNTDPHGKKLNGKIKSFLRFSFYNLDFIIGTWMKIIPLKIKKKLVIFDRYYYDYYADMARYQYSLPTWVAKMFAWCIPSPDLIFVLDAPAEILYQRKQELPIEELRKQREAFKTFAENKRNAVLVDATQDAKQVADSITEKVLRYKAEQTAKLMHCTLDDEGVPV